MIWIVVATIILALTVVGGFELRTQPTDGPPCPACGSTKTSHHTAWWNDECHVCHVCRHVWVVREES